MSSVSVIGTLGSDPELRYTNNGSAGCTLSVCENRKRGEDTQAHWYDVQCWGQLAENVAESLRKGQRVIVVGQLEQRSWQTQDGQKRSKVQIVAWQVGPSLEYATAAVTRNERDNDQ